MPEATLSVVMTNYNHARYLPAALAGVLDQSRPASEVIIVDDCSTDNSVEVIEEFARRYPTLRLVRNERNMGTEYSSNRAMALATGDYVCGAAADDVLFPAFFERAMQLLARYPQAGLCSARSTVIDAATDLPVCCLPLELVSSGDAFITPARALEWLRTREPWVMGNACIYDRRALVAEGGFIRELRSYCDGFMQMLLAVKRGACFIPEPLAMWRVSAEGYASATQSRIVPALEMWRHAANLMRTKYADVFPADFVDQWERQRLCEARVGAVLRLQRQELAVLRSAGAGEGFPVRMLAAVVTGTQKLGLLSGLCYQRLRGDTAVWTVGLHMLQSRWRRRATRQLAAETLSRLANQGPR